MKHVNVGIQRSIDYDGSAEGVSLDIWTSIFGASLNDAGEFGQKYWRGVYYPVISELRFVTASHLFQGGE